MSLDSSTINRRRHLALCVLRSLAILHSAFGLAVVGIVLMGRTERLIGFDYWWYAMPIIFGGMFFWGPALLLAMASRRLSRWIMPAPDLGCPNCGYSLKNLNSPICPECGTPLGKRAAG